jgi:uncharacterized DUF497 family protein
LGEQRLKIVGFIWLEEIVEKLSRKHHVDAAEVAELFANAPRFLFVEKGHRTGENVYSGVGQTDAGRYLICFFVYKQDRRALVLSARDMSGAERKRYERK